MNDTYQVVCPACATTNRLHRGKPASAGKCGRCQAALFQGQPINVNSEAFYRHISNNQIPVLVDFWAAWCGPCKMMAPTFAEAASTLEPNVRLLKVDTEAERAIAAHYGIQSIPTLALFSDGQEVARQAGAMSLQALLTWLRPYLL